MFIRIFCVAACCITPKQQGQAIAQAFRHRPLTTGSTPVIPYRICGGQRVGGKDFFSRVFRFHPGSIIPLTFHNLSFIYHRRHILAIDSVVKWHSLKKTLNKWPIILTRYRVLTLYLRVAEARKQADSTPCICLVNKANLVHSFS
jgi:hypothetical protein